MSKKKNTPIKSAHAVEGEIVRIDLDFSSGIGDVPLEQWTRGPILPVGGNESAAKNGKRVPKRRKKGA